MSQGPAPPPMPPTRRFPLLRAGTEKAEVLAFLKHGHPWLAFGVVLLKTALRAGTLVLVAVLVISLKENPALLSAALRAL